MGCFLPDSSLADLICSIPMTLALLSPFFILSSPPLPMLYKAASRVVLLTQRLQMQPWAPAVIFSFIFCRAGAFSGSARVFNTDCTVLPPRGTWLGHCCLAGVTQPVGAVIAKDLLSVWWNSDFVLRLASLFSLYIRFMTRSHIFFF